MLMNYPSFISKQEQDSSRLLYNSIKLTLQTSVGEIWYDENFGTTLREQIKHGIDVLTVAEIQNNIEENLLKYFENDIILNYLDAWQEDNKVLVNLTYTELKTGKKQTITTEETFINKDVSLY